MISNQQKKELCFLQLEDLQLNYWEFAAEGNQHLLIKCVNQQNRLNGYLLRFNKQPHLKDQSDGLTQETAVRQLDAILEKSCKEYLFNKLIPLQPFLLEAHEVDLQQCQGQFNAFVGELEKKISSKRKRDKNIDLTQKIEIIENLQQDYNETNKEMSSFMVEIKPKSPLEEKYSSEQISEQLVGYSTEEREIIMKRFQTASATEKCRFFKMQLNKRHQNKNNEIVTLSKYSPVGLFEGNISEQLKNLVETPMNNFKIISFRNNEKQVYQQVELIEKVPQLSKALKIIERMINLFSESNASAEKVFSSFISQSVYYCSQEYQAAFFESVLNNIREEIETETINLQEQLLRDLQKAEQNDKFFECKVVLKFLLSIAFRDLSLLINIFVTEKEEDKDNQKEIASSKVVHDKFKINQLLGKTTQYQQHSRLVIIDYDLKPISAYAKQVQIEQVNLQLYIKYLLEEAQNNSNKN